MCLKLIIFKMMQYFKLINVISDFISEKNIIVIIPLLLLLS